MVVLYIHFN